MTKLKKIALSTVSGTVLAVILLLVAAELRILISIIPLLAGAFASAGISTKKSWLVVVSAIAGIVCSFIAILFVPYYVYNELGGLLAQGIIAALVASLISSIVAVTIDKQ
jgi:hypothetical protein